MQSRKDLLQAHRLMTQRAALALLQAEPDPPDRPLRRLNVGVFSSVLVAVILVAIFGIWGLVAPGKATGLTAPGTLIIDSQTGTSYIWCQHNGKRLCPVLNYASARLALDASSVNQRSVSQSSLAGYPRGPLIGIPGLPQALPASSMLVGGPWSVCVQSLTSPGTLQRHQVTTLVGGHRVGGKALSPDDALLVQAAGAQWLIWNGERMPIPAREQQNVLTALDTTQPPESMPSAWLNAFPQSSAFAPPSITGFGRTVSGPSGGSAKVGQVFTTSAAPGAPEQSYVMLGNGKLEKISQAQAALLNAAPDQATPGTVNASTAASDSAPGSLPSNGLPTRMPKVVPYNSTTPLCVVYGGSATVAPSGPRVTVGGSVPSYGVATNGLGGVNQVALPPGTGALLGVVAGTEPAAGAGQAPVVSSYFLLTGGLRYGLTSQSVAAVLGYTLPGQRSLVPAEVADLIPQGPALDPSKAQQQVSG
jgi:type VII secretion protein EccB